MAEIVAVYDLDPAPRTAEDIIPTRRSSPQDKPARRPGPVVTGKWLAANVTDDIPAVIAAMFDEAERRDPAHERTWVALVDGNRQQDSHLFRPGGTSRTLPPWTPLRGPSGGGSIIWRW